MRNEFGSYGKVGDFARRRRARRTRASKRPGGQLAAEPEVDSAEEEKEEIERGDRRSGLKRAAAALHQSRGPVVG